MWKQAARDLSARRFLGLSDESRRSRDIFHGAVKPASANGLPFLFLRWATRH
jgi:hypothetical protein